VIACRLFRRLDGHHYPPHAAVPPTLLAIADELIEWAIATWLRRSTDELISLSNVGF
jgi:hypothetical protein